MGLRSLALGFFLGLILVSLNPQLLDMLNNFSNNVVDTIMSTLDEITQNNLSTHNDGGLEEAVAEVNHWLEVYTSWEERYKFYDQLLATSIEQARSMGWLPAAKSSGERALEVFRWIVLRLSYYPDSHVRYVAVNGSVNVRDQVYMLPNETVANGGGDCEDLALTAYAMLKATQKQNEEVYLIIWYNATEGHAAVLLAEKTPQGKRYYIVDPAGDYLNGIGIYFLALTKNARGQEQYMSLTPLDVSHRAKQQLLDRQLVSIAYYHHHEKKWHHDMPPLEYYTSADKAVRDWIRYWNITLVKLEIHDIGVHKEFANTTSLAQWLEKS